MLFRVRVPIFYWPGESHRATLIQKPQPVLKLLQLQSENALCPWEVWFSRRKKKKWQCALMQKAAQSPGEERELWIQQKKRSCPCVLQRVPTTVQGLQFGLCYLSTLFAYCCRPDSSGAPVKRTRSHCTERTSGFSAGCSPVITHWPIHYSDKPLQFFNP